MVQFLGLFQDSLRDNFVYNFSNNFDDNFWDCFLGQFQGNTSDSKGPKDPYLHSLMYIDISINGNNPFQTQIYLGKVCLNVNIVKHFSEIL